MMKMTFTTLIFLTTLGAKVLYRAMIFFTVIITLMLIYHY